MIKQSLQVALTNSLFGWKKPTHLILHVTSRCNGHCGMCFAWRRLGKDTDLTISEIKNIAKTLNRLVFLDISGGEPFLRSDLPNILTTFQKYSPNAYVNLPTNGFLPDKVANLTKEILRKTNLPISLNLSLDGLAPTHERIRGVNGGFQKVMQTYQNLAKIKKDYPRLSLKISTVISQLNFTQLEKLSDYIIKTMPDIDFHTLILVRGEPKDKRFALPPLEELEAKKEIFFKIWQRYDYGKNLGLFGERVANRTHRLLFDHYLNTLKHKKMVVPCLAGLAHAVVYANGDLAFCELRQPIGNLRRTNFNFQKLWQDHEAEKQRQAIKHNHCFCTHGCVWTDNLFLNPKAYPKIAWELLKSTISDNK